MSSTRPQFEISISSPIKCCECKSEVNSERVLLTKSKPIGALIEVIYSEEVPQMYPHNSRNALILRLHMLEVIDKERKFVLFQKDSPVRSIWPSIIKENFSFRGRNIT